MMSQTSYQEDYDQLTKGMIDIGLNALEMMGDEFTTREYTEAIITLMGAGWNWDAYNLLDHFSILGKVVETNAQPFVHKREYRKDGRHAV